MGEQHEACDNFVAGHPSNVDANFQGCIFRNLSKVPLGEGEGTRNWKRIASKKWTSHDYLELCNANSGCHSVEITSFGVLLVEGL